MVPNALHTLDKLKKWVSNNPLDNKSLEQLEEKVSELHALIIMRQG